MVQTTRSSVFWIIFSALSVTSALIAFYLFPRAFPIVTLDVTMDRHQATSAAHTLATQFELGPQDAQQSVSFVTDDLTKTFIELESGGAQQFMRLIEQKLYQPYTWHIRHFKPYDAHELLIKYTPQGTAYGFIETMPEQLAGASLTRQKAQTLAENFATHQWHTDLTPYALVESSQETVASGRIDHTFVYERTDETIGEGFYRLTLVVSGDKVTQLNHSIKVPNNFIRRYQQMRTANDTIARVAQLLILFLYLIGGMLGLFFFMRRRWVLWKPAILCGFLIAFLHFCIKLNEIPLMWMEYQTALSPVGFILHIITQGINGFVYMALLYAIIFAIAETFTRAAFGTHQQFWQLWNIQSASSYTVLRATVTGYLVVPIFMLFLVLFYIFANSYLHWWIPSQVFFEPDILATYLPWLSSLSKALGAGFMEECLFRAIPIAGAILLSRRWGHQTLFVITAFILQAVIFGAAHANYPMQPAYARLVELLIPSCGFGALYYFLGLFPAVIAHVIYDVVWMALPIFTNHSSSAFIHTLIVIALSLIPCWVILYARLKQGHWSELPATNHNEYWRPQLHVPSHTDMQVPPQSITISSFTRTGIFAAACIALIAWAFNARFTADAPTMRINRQQALQIAHDYFTAHNISITEPWKLLTRLIDDTNNTMYHAFVWQTGGKDVYHQLQGSYLTKPRWLVRLAHFEGDIIARAQEYNLFIDETGTILRIHHQLPETWEKSSLTQAQARTLAHTQIKTHYGIDPTTLTEISAQEEKRPNRKDWLFTFADQNNYPLQTGQARICVEIAGDEIVDTYRYIFVPQEWRRSYENMSTISNTIKQLCGLCIYLIFITATLASLWYLTRTTTPMHNSSPILLLIFVTLFLLSLINGLPKLTVTFDTCKSWYNQYFMQLITWSVSAIIKAATLASTLSIIFLVHNYYKTLHTHLTRIVLGSSIGIIFAACFATAEKLISATHPLWPTYSYLNSYLPLYEFFNSHLMGYISFTLLVLIVILLARHLTRAAKYSRILPITFLSATGFIFAGAYYAANIPLLLTIGTITALLLLITFYTLLRYDYQIIPCATASYTLLALLQEHQMVAAPATPWYTYLSMSTIILLSIGWYVLMNRQNNTHTHG